MEDWTQKYRPKSLNEIVGNEKAIIELKKWANQWITGKPNKKAVILSGKPGIGKTSSAIALANDYKWTIIELNTSDVRNEIKIKKVVTTGSINETFTDDGNFISSKKGGRKLIILDEADNLYEKVESSLKNANDLSDKGGKKAIIDTIKITNQPIILIVNDYYSLIKGSGNILKNICKHIKFFPPYPNYIINLLKKISLNESIDIEKSVLITISDKSRGDIRSAINDLYSISANKNKIDIKSLQVLGYRDRRSEIFDALREIFKTSDINTIKVAISHLDIDPKQLILWINENLPREYLNKDDLANGYNILSKADIFLGRTNKKQKYSLWSYACDIMSGGVANVKTHMYHNNNYNFPSWLKKKKDFRDKNEIKNLIIKKLCKNLHISYKKCKEQILLYFIYMFKNKTSFAIIMKNNYDLSEKEIKFLLGETHKNKLKDLIKSDNFLVEKSKNKEDINIYLNKKKENLQKRLFDY